MNKHGDWIWYELITADADAASEFYQKIVGWSIDGSATNGMDYRYIKASGGMVGGILPISPDMTAGGARPGWLGYVGVDDVDKAVASVEAGGGKVHMPARDIENVGRLAMVSDPQGAAFYVMRAASDQSSSAFAYEQPMDGHCAWNELQTNDPDAALHFYGTRFGWMQDGDMDMGPMGKYRFLRHGGLIGAVMPRPPHMPVSAWSFYFRVHDIDVAAEAVKTGGGQVLHGPVAIPGDDFSMNAVDPQGAMFALVGKRN